MSEEQQQSSASADNPTSITRAWRLGGPMTAAHRKEAKQAFLEYLKKDPNVSAAADHACIHRDTAYDWREKDEAFATGWANAIERTKDVARSSIYRRGIIGWDETVVSNGQVVYEMEPILDKDGNQVIEKGKTKVRRGNAITVHKWSDQLAIAYAKANLPEFREKQQVDLQTNINSKDIQALHEAIAQSLSSYPEAKIALAEALIEMEKARGN